MPFDSVPAEKPVSPDKLAAADIVTRAMTLISEPDRWCQGFGSIRINGGPPVARCMLNALAAAEIACGRLSLSPLGLANRAVARVAARRLGSNVGSSTPIVHFNDKESTKHSDVLAAMREAAAELHVGSSTPIVLFNDKESTKHSDVLAVMREAAAELRGEAPLNLLVSDIPHKA